MKIFFQFFSIFISVFVFSQNDTIQRHYNYKKLNIGVDYDLENSNIGFSISNGIEVKPLIHFEDFSDDFLYKFRVRTNFNKDFGLETVLAYDLGFKFLQQVGIESKYYDYQNLKLKNIGLSVTKNIRRLQIGFILKPNFQQLNEENNFGLEVGLQKVLIYNKLYSEVGFGYYSDYFTYNFLLQSFIYKHKLGINACFEKIGQFQFLKIGVNFVLSKKVIF